MIVRIGEIPHILSYMLYCTLEFILYISEHGTHAYYSMSSALILLTYEIENPFFFFFFFSQCYGGNQVGVTYCMGQWGLAKFGMLLVASCLGPRQKHFGGVGRVLYWATLHGHHRPPWRTATHRYSNVIRTSTYPNYSSQPSSHLWV